MPLIIPSNSISAGGYEVDNSLRFNSGSSDNLSRTPATTGTSRQIMTFSFWTKRSGFETTNAYRLFSTFYGGGASQFWIRFADSGEGINKISIVSYDSGFSIQLITTQVFRDPSAWYHVVVAFDTTQATSTNRVKLYINGSQVTSFSTSTYPSLNYNLQWNVTQSNQIGGNGVSGNEYYNGYMSEVCFIDGQQLDATSFGEFDEDTGIWKPIDVSGLTFGTNGFYLDFENSGSLGADASGNGNNFTVNNLTSIDQTTDTPTNNFATANPLNSTLTNSNLSEGNLQFAGGSQSVNYAFTSGTIAPSQGKWYWEVKAVDNAEIDQVGVAKMDLAQFANISNSGGLQATTYGGKGVQLANGVKVGDGSQSTYMGGFSANDILMVALNLDSGSIYFGRNGQWSDGAGNANQTFANAVAAYTNLTVGDAYVAAHCMRNSGGSNPGESEYNFGNPPFTIASGNSDANGIGNFEYAVPSGYYALCTKNLAEFG